MIRSSGIQPLPPQSFHIHPDREIEVLFEIIPVPASVIFKSNQAQAVVHFNGRSYKPGDTIFVEPFREIKLSAICGRDHLVRSINKLQPGEKVSVDFSFLKKKHPKHDLFLKGMDLFSKQKYKDALKFLEDAAKSDHMEAALKTAEIYERGLGMWFSDSGKAMKWYHKAAELGDVPSALKIAAAVENGDYDAPASQMLKYYSYAVPLKNAAVIYKISTFYKNGFRDIPQNDAKSLHYLIMAAELGLPEAMFELGI
ncbi:MAG: sel1 repeat family protein, partial [Lentisphaeria bacterium]|nr:sel1 repeat family protein [Lentisphaeria bacterium]